MHFRKDKNVMMFYNINFSEVNVPLKINVSIFCWINVMLHYFFYPISCVFMKKKKRDSYWIIHQKAQATLGFIALNEWTKAHTY